MLVVYIAHPLGAPTLEEQIANRESAKDWVAWAAEQGVSPQATWIALSERWPRSRAEEALKLDCELVRRCDELWLCGPVVSPGMQKEKETAELYGIPIRRYVTLNTKESDT